MLNEMEIIVWSTFLDQYDLDSDEKFTVEDYVFNTAFYIKLFLNEDEQLRQMFVSYFNCYIKHFIDKFNTWTGVNKNKFELDPVLMNSKFKVLNAPYNPKNDKEYIDYNNWVDDILNISPPYHTNAQYNPTYQSQGGSQLSIIPKRKRVKTIPFNPSQHSIDWKRTKEVKKDDNDDLLNSSQQAEVFESQKNKRQPEQKMQKKDLKSEELKVISEEKVSFDKSPNLAGEYLESNLSKLYDFNNPGEHVQNPNDFDPDALFASSNVNGTQNMFTKEKKTKDKQDQNRNNFDIKASLSWMSNGSINLGKDRYPSNILNPASVLNDNLKHSLVKINPKDFSGFHDKDQDAPSPQASDLEALLKNEDTPVLFRGDSGVINPQTLKRE